MCLICKNIFIRSSAPRAWKALNFLHSIEPQSGASSEFNDGDGFLGDKKLIQNQTRMDDQKLPELTLFWSSLFTIFPFLRHGLLSESDQPYKNGAKQNKLLFLTMLNPLTHTTKN